MPLLKFVTYSLPHKTQILITNSASHISHEIIAQLQQYSHIEPIPYSDVSQPPPAFENLGVVLHILTNGTGTLSEILSYTTATHKLLALCQSHHAKFILVVPHSSSHLYHTTISLVTQFGKNFPLNYHILQVDKTAKPTDIAFEVIKTFVHGHKKNSAPPPPVSHPAPLPPAVKRPRRSSRRLLWVGLALLFVPWVLLALQLLLLVLFFSCSLRSTQSFSLPQAVRCSRYSLRLATTVSLQTRLLPGSKALLLRLGLPPDEGQNLLRSQYFALSNLHQLNSLVATSLAHLFSSSPTSPPIRQLHTLTTLSADSLAQLQTDLRSLYLSSALASRHLDPFVNSFSSIRSVVSKFQYLSDELPQLLSLNKLSHIAILVQDNTELRPSGGFIDSLVLATLKDGKITHLQFHSAQTADDQLRGAIDPPSDLKALTSKSQWYLRDSNWSQDLSYSARQAAWFLDRELSFRPDYLIFTNLNSLASFLRITGPIKLDDQPVTAQTLISQYHSYLQKPALSPRPPFITQLVGKLLETIPSLSESQLQKASLQLAGQLESRQISIFSLTSPQSKYDAVGWGGGVNLPSCRTQDPCVTTYFFQTDTNIGENKVDSSITKTLQSDIQLSPESILTTFRLDYTNQSPYPTWPMGDHKNYLRFTIPSSARLESVFLNQKKISLPQLISSHSPGLSTFGLLVETSPRSSSQVVIKLSQPTPATRYHYQLDIPNQPGASAFPSAVNFSYPQSWPILAYAAPLTFSLLVQPDIASPGRLQYNTLTIAPIHIDIDITPPTSL